MRSPITGDVREVSVDEAQSLVFRAGWEPVVEPAAVRLLERQVAREKASPYEAALYGLARGVSGGLIEGALPQGEEPGALALQGVREEYPGTALGGELVGSLLPLSKAAGAMRFASPVALAAEAGEGVAALGGGALGRVATRAAGTALEGGIIGSTYEAGQSAIEDTPLTAQKLLSGFAAGAIPGALIGLPLGAAEGLGARFARRAEGLQNEVNLPAVGDADLMKIAHREHGVPTPGMLEDVQAAIGRDAVPKDALALYKAKGPVGEQVRKELLEAPRLREQAEHAVAAGLNDIQELDDRAIQGWIHGQPKKDLIRQWIAVDAPAEIDVGEALAHARNADLPDRAPMVERVTQALDDATRVDPELQAGLARDLSPLDTDLKTTLTRGLVAQDGATSQAVLDAMRTANPKARAAFDAAMGDAVVPRWRANGVQLLDDMGKRADDLMGLSPGVLGQSRAEARKVRDLIANARGKFVSGDRADAYAALDELKGRLGPHAKPDEWLSGDDNVARLVRGGYEDIRAMLEDPSYWGDRAAGAQREINALLHRRLARADGYFKQFFQDAGVPHPRNPWVNARVATPGKVNAALKGIIDPDKSDALAMFKGHVAETRDLAAKMKEFYNLSPEASADVDRLLKGVDQAENGMDRAVLYARREAHAQELFGNGHPVVPREAKWVALGLLGAPGYAAVRGLEAIANPGARIHARAVLERILRGSESRMAKAALGLLTGKRINFPHVGATQLAARGTTSLLREKDPKKRAESYASSLAELQMLTSPAKAQDVAAKMLPSVVETVPGAHANMAAMLSRAAQYILARAPVRPVLTPRGVEVEMPSDSELSEWEDIWAGAMDPVSAVEDAAAGRGSMEGMRAAEAAAPELIQEVRFLIQTEIGNQDVPHNRVVDLSLVLGVPLDASLEPDYIGAQQMMHAARFKESESMASRRSFQETGVNSGYRKPEQSAADRIESDEPPK